MQKGTSGKYVATRGVAKSLASPVDTPAVSVRGGASRSGRQERVAVLAGREFHSVSVITAAHARARTHGTARGAAVYRRRIR